MSHNLYNDIMLQITKQILCFVVCVAITCGCTTTSTRTFANYRDDGSQRTPITSYISRETTTTVRKSQFKENAFWFWKTAVREDEVPRYILWGIPLAIDLVSLPIVALLHTTETYVNYENRLSLRGKLVDVNNEPLANYSFQVSSKHGISEVNTNDSGIFEIELISAIQPTNANDVTFIFPNKNVHSIVYTEPFLDGTRNTVFPTDYKVHQSNIRATGNVIVLDKKPTTLRNNKARNKDEIARQRARNLFKKQSKSGLW